MQTGGRIKWAGLFFMPRCRLSSYRAKIMQTGSIMEITHSFFYVILWLISCFEAVKVRKDVKMPYYLIKICYETCFFSCKVCQSSKSPYICNVFFIVLDLRLTKVGVQRYSFFMPIRTVPRLGAPAPLRSPTANLHLKSINLHLTVPKLTTGYFKLTGTCVQVDRHLCPIWQTPESVATNTGVWQTEHQCLTNMPKTPFTVSSRKEKGRLICLPRFRHIHSVPA